MRFILVFTIPRFDGLCPACAAPAPRRVYHDITDRYTDQGDRIEALTIRKNCDCPDVTESTFQDNHTGIVRELVTITEGREHTFVSEGFEDAVNAMRADQRLRRGIYLAMERCQKAQSVPNQLKRDANAMFRTRTARLKKASHIEAIKAEMMAEIVPLIQDAQARAERFGKAFEVLEATKAKYGY